MRSRPARAAAAAGLARVATLTVTAALALALALAFAFALAIALLLALATWPTTSPALADGDPASDVLLGQNVFYPYNPPVSTATQRSLNAETAAAATAGFPVKVALIASPVDLGVIPSLFNKPQKYADFLDQEISFQNKQLLLVVMPAGYGVKGLTAPATAAVAKLPKPAGKTSEALAAAAIAAVPKLAAAAGHQLSAASTPSGSSSGSAGGGSNTGRTVLLIVLVLAVIATAGALVAVRRRRGEVRDRG